MAVLIRPWIGLPVLAVAIPFAAVENHCRSAACPSIASPAGAGDCSLVGAGCDAANMLVARASAQSPAAVYLSAHWR